MLTNFRIKAIATILTVANMTSVYSASSTAQANANQRQQNANQRQNANQQKQAPAQSNEVQQVQPAAAAPAAPQAADTSGKPAIDMGRLSEAFGHFIGRNLKTPGVNFDLERIIKGERDGIAGKPAPMTDQEYEQMMTALQEQVFEQLSQDNLKAANEFLAKNAKEKGVFEVEPGKLQYVVLQEGKGETVQADAKPMINYTGRYLDGTVFDTSDNVGGPVAIPLGQTIGGFSRGLVGMKEGEKRKIFIHPDLGYGTQSPLPPNAMLIFEVEVVKANSSDKDDHEEKEDHEEKKAE